MTFGYSRALMNKHDFKSTKKSIVWMNNLKFDILSFAFMIYIETNGNPTMKFDLYIWLLIKFH